LSVYLLAKYLKNIYEEPLIKEDYVYQVIHALVI